MFSILLMCCTSCSQYIDPDVPEPIHPLVDPELHTPYELYRPSNYDRNSAWPLIVACHSQPADSPNKQIRDWTLLAETYGFVVVAPRLEGTKSFWPPAANKQIALQKQDEQRILATIRHVRASHNISDDRIFIHGFSGGTHAALYTGLNNPDIFRVISIIKPYFNSGFLADIHRAFDPHQLVYIHYSIDDSLMGKHAKRCVDWLRAKGVSVKEDSSGSARRIECQRTVEYYQSVIRNVPWLQIRAFPVNRKNPLEFQFKLRSSFQPQHIEWVFGDTNEQTETSTINSEINRLDEKNKSIDHTNEIRNNNKRNRKGRIRGSRSRHKKSALAAPIHIFPHPGPYPVTVTVEDSTGQKHTRAATISIPSGKLTPTTHTP